MPAGACHRGAAQKEMTDNTFDPHFDPRRREEEEDLPALENAQVHTKTNFGKTDGFSKIGLGVHLRVLVRLGLWSV